MNDIFLLILALIILILLYTLVLFKGRLNRALKELEMIKNKELNLLSLNTKLSAQNEIYKKSLDENKQNYEKSLSLLEAKFENNLKNQSQNLLNQNKLMINENLKNILNESFTPLKQSVSEYSKRLNENEISLKTNIENMFKFSQNLGANADRLAKILKGDKKIRGNFAELQLKSVLENSGLIEGQQYKMQKHFKEGDKGYFADAVVFLDKQKNIVIDSKFSLPDSFDFNEISNELCLQLAKNLRARIDELASKPYNKFNEHSHEFVLLFVPYQNILDLVFSVDNEIYQYAAKKHLYLCSPNTLFMALNTINISWSKIKAEENISKAFNEIAKFYDKFVGVIEDFEKLKNASKNLNNQLENMQNKLIGGVGNLSSRFERLKTLGIKTQKSLPNQNVD